MRTGHWIPPALSVPPRPKCYKAGRRLHAQGQKLEESSQKKNGTGEKITHHLSRDNCAKELKVLTLSPAPQPTDLNATSTSLQGED